MDDDERFKPEWRDFEKRFQNQLREPLENLKGLPNEIRTETEDKVRERFRRYENEIVDLEKKEPNFSNPSTQSKHMSLNEFMHRDADIIVKKAHEAQKAKELASQYSNARDASQKGKDQEHDRER